MNYDVNKISIIAIDRSLAKKVCQERHYMKTFPAGANLFFGIKHEGISALLGVAVFGKSSTTDKKLNLFPGNLKSENIIEMQRLWLSDLLGKNAESKTLSLIISKIKINYHQIKILWTYAGGCKNDCGIVYQSSGFMYLKSEPCDDFYLTRGGEYKNIISALKFGKAPKALKSKEDIAKYLYGPGEFIKSFRHYYFYPLDKGIRRKMQNKVLPFPKFSAIYRKDQKWISGDGQGDGSNILGSTPSISTIAHKA